MTGSLGIKCVTSLALLFILTDPTQDPNNGSKDGIFKHSKGKLVGSGPAKFPPIVILPIPPTPHSSVLAGSIELRFIKVSELNLRRRLKELTEFLLGHLKLL